MHRDIIRTEGLGKTFIGRHGSVEAVRDLDVTVTAGEIVALRGPSGSGKTTIARMLVGLLRPTSGRVWVAGCDPADRVGTAGHRRSLVGYVAQAGPAGAAGRVLDEFRHRGRFADLDAAEVQRRALDLLDQWDLAGLSHSDLGALSDAQRRRLELALALLHSPALLVADDPAGGLDEQEHRALWLCLDALRRRTGCTVVVTVRDATAALAADRVIDLTEGRVPAARRHLEAAA